MAKDEETLIAINRLESTVNKMYKLIKVIAVVLMGYIFMQSIRDAMLAMASPINSDNQTWTVDLYVPANQDGSDVFKVNWETLGTNENDNTGLSIRSEKTNIACITGGFTLGASLVGVAATIVALTLTSQGRKGAANVIPVCSIYILTVILLLFS